MMFMLLCFVPDFEMFSVLMVTIGSFSIGMSGSDFPCCSGNFRVAFDMWTGVFDVFPLVFCFRLCCTWFHRYCLSLFVFFGISLSHGSDLSFRSISGHRNLSSRGPLYDALWTRSQCPLTWATPASPIWTRGININVESQVAIFRCRIPRKRSHAEIMGSFQIFPKVY